MLGEREFFIRKALGWVLRETGKRRPQLVEEWLRPRAALVSRLTLREAIKPLPAQFGAEMLALAGRARRARGLPVINPKRRWRPQHPQMPRDPL
jgi:hypothetical protein